ncbi:TadE family protein [Kineococcus gynurae]|uniref:TadE family protein n=1 Tax=Kineococcus gynurae TaxID=452979 RepID=UPI0035E819AB
MTPRGTGTRDRGSAALELAVVAPALLLLVFTAVQVGLWGYGRAVAQQAAREGVSQYRLAADARTAELYRPVVEAHVRGYAGTLGREALTDATVASTWVTDPTGRPRVEVAVTGTTITLVPGLHLAVTGRAQGSVERFGDGR